MLVLAVENRLKTAPIVEMRTFVFLFLPSSTCTFIWLLYLSSICQKSGKLLVRLRYLPAWTSGVASSYASQPPHAAHEG